MESRELLGPTLDPWQLMRVAERTVSIVIREWLTDDTRRACEDVAAHVEARESEGDTEEWANRLRGLLAKVATPCAESKTADHMLARTVAQAVAEEEARCQTWRNRGSEGTPDLVRAIGGSGCVMRVWVERGEGMRSSIEAGVFLDDGAYLTCIAGTEEVCPSLATRGFALRQFDPLRLAATFEHEMAQAGGFEQWAHCHRKELVRRAATVISTAEGHLPTPLALSEAQERAVTLGGEVVLTGTLCVVMEVGLPCRVARVDLGDERTLPFAMERATPSDVYWQLDEGHCVTFLSARDAHTRGELANRALKNDVAGPLGEVPLPGGGADEVTDVLYGAVLAVGRDLATDELCDLTEDEAAYVTEKLADPGSGLRAERKVLERMRRERGLGADTMGLTGSEVLETSVPTRKKGRRMARAATQAGRQRGHK